MRLANDEKGIALILTLFLAAAGSALAASLMFLAQTETYASASYRTMTQARYGAESGIHRTVNFLLNSYTAPTTTSGTDPLSNYNLAVSPVTYNGAAVKLCSDATQSNYPAAAVKTAFATATTGSLLAEHTTVTYAPCATLLSMQTLPSYGGAVTAVQTWQMTSTGRITVGSAVAEVEVSSTLEKQVVPLQTWAAFGTAGTCGALSFGGGAVTNSYDSSALVAGAPVIANNNGNVGTNGNLTEGGSSTTINGTLSTPRVGVGSCSNGNVDALSSSGGATVTGGVVQLPQAVTMETPALPNPLPTSGTHPNVSVNSGTGNLTIAPGTYYNVNVANSKVLHLQAGTYNINTIQLGSGGSIVIDSYPVIMNVVGTGSTTPIDLSGGAASNASFDPAKFQITYAGTNTVKLTGGAQNSALIYAPNAPITFSGNGDWYGTIVGKTLTNTGGGKLHYDRHLSKSFLSAGNDMLTSFSWKKY